MGEVSSAPAGFLLLKLPTMRRHHPSRQDFPHRRRGPLQAGDCALTRLLLDRV